MKEGDVITFGGEVGIVEELFSTYMWVRFVDIEFNYMEHSSDTVSYTDYYRGKDSLKYAYYWCRDSWNEHWDTMRYDDAYRFNITMLCIIAFLITTVLIHFSVG